MAAKGLQLFQRSHGCFDTLRRLQRAHPSEIARGNRGEEIHTHIRWGSPMRHGRFGIFLEIVGREKMILRGNEGLEESPRSARYQSQSLRDAGGERLCLRQAGWLADPSCNGRRYGPQNNEWQGR